MRFFKLTIITFLFSSTVFSQKDIDLNLLNVYTDSTNLISDSIYDQMGLSIPFEYFIQFTNQGVNSIIENDTILLHYYVNGVKKVLNPSFYLPIDSIPYTGLELQPNDTMLLRIIVFNDYGSYANENDGIIHECFELIPSSTSTELQELTPSDNIICYDRYVNAGELSTENKKAILPLKLYPNPSSDFINFNYPIKNIHIYSISGQRIDNFIRVNEFRIDISRLDEGIYIIKGERDGINFMKEIIVKK